MAKQQIIDLENGSTLIYQKQNFFNGASFVIAFRSGWQLDGKYEGLSHLLEHLLFDGTTEDITKSISEQILKHTIGQNAYTNSSYIATEFAATNDHLAKALDNVMHLFTKKEFTPEQIKKEANVVKQEIYLYRDMGQKVVKSAKHDLIYTLIQSQVPNATAGLGNEKTLKMVTPELLVKYMERYFNLDNLVISVTTNKPLNEILELLEEKVYPKFQPATDEKYIVPYDDCTPLSPQNYFIAYPNNESKTVKINLVLKEREDEFPQDINKEYAFDTIEEYIMNHISGILFEKLRIDNSLVYAYNLENVDFGLGKLKIFTATTNGAKMRKTVKVLCETLREFSTNGFPRKRFEDVKKALTDYENAKLNKFKPCSALDNFNQFMEGIEFVDYKKVMNYIKEMTYEEFNEYVSRIYKNAKVSLAIDGDFDSRNCYSLIEVEEMLGNYTHKAYKSQLNVPIFQATTPSGNFIDLLQNVLQPINMESATIPKTVTIDDQELFENSQDNSGENKEVKHSIILSDKEKIKQNFTIPQKDKWWKYKPYC